MLTHVITQMFTTPELRRRFQHRLPVHIGHTLGPHAWLPYLCVFHMP